MKVTFLFFFSICFLFIQQSMATPCGELVYNKHGKFRKYEYVPNTATENTKKHGYSTTSGVSTEGSTASSDPGVSTGVTQSNQQSTSTKGECKWGGLFASRDEYKEYLAQNISEIKNEMALASGGHLEILASAFDCNQEGRQKLPKLLQKNFSRFVSLEAPQSTEFAASIKQVVDFDLSQSCTSI